MTFNQIDQKIIILKNVSQAIRYKSLEKKYKFCVGLLATFFIIMLTSMFFEKWELFITGFLAYVGIQIEVIKYEKLKNQLASKDIESSKLDKLKEDTKNIVEEIKLFVSDKSNGFNQNDDILKLFVGNKLAGLESEIGAIIYLVSENKDKFDVSEEIIQP